MRQVHVRQLAHLLPRRALPPGKPAGTAPLEGFGFTDTAATMYPDTLYQYPALLLQGVEDVNLRRYLRWATTGELKDPTKAAPAAGAPQTHKQIVQRRPLTPSMLMYWHICKACMQS